MAELEEGTLFAGYRIGPMLGRGGMGVVYEATETALDRRVALKVIAAEAARDEVFREQFERESRVAAKVDDPHVIPIYTVGREGETLFIAMRLVPGLDLGEKLSRRRLDPAEAARLIAQVAEGLDAIHAAGLVHRDVKPSNILLAGDEGSEHAYVADFGLAKLAATSSGLTRQGRVVGTLDYVSPEQIEQRPVDARADVYSLGCVLYKALTGRIPFERETDAAKLWAHVHEDPRPPSALGNVPVAFDGVIERAMAKRPEDRYPSAGDLGRAAVAAAAGREVTASERWVATGDAAAGPPKLMLENEEGTTGDLARRYAHEEPTPMLGTGTPKPPRKRRRIPRALIFGLLGAAVGVGVYLVQRPSDSGPSPEVKRLIGRADEICTESRGLFNAAASQRADTFEKAARQAERERVVSQRALEQLRHLSVPPGVAGEWATYLRLREVQIRRFEQARDAANRGDNPAYQRAQRKIARGQQYRFEAARQVGLRQCSRGI